MVKKSRELLEVVHSIPGRVRFTYKSTKAEISILDDFYKIKGIKEITFNKITQSLLIIYDREIITIEQLLSKIQEGNPDLDISKERLPNNSSDILLTNNLLLDKFYKTAIGTNKKINKKMKGRADLTSLVPSGLLLLGLEELIRKPVMPRWYDLVWWSYTLLQQNYPKWEKDSSITISKPK